MENCFTILLLNKKNEEEEEKWTFSYNYYSYKVIEMNNSIVINVFNNFGTNIKTFSNAILYS